MNNITLKLIKLALIFYFLITLTSCSNNANFNNTTPTKVAILMPLAGENQIIGKKYTDLIKLGLARKAKTKFKVTSYDISNRAKLKDAVAKILATKTDIIIGPIYSDETRFVASQIKNKDIIMLSLSNDPTIASDNIFIFGHAPIKQINQITDYLIANGHKNYLTLFPDTIHGHNISKIIQNKITTQDKIIKSQEFYQENLENLPKIVTKISNIVDELNEQDENLTRPVIFLNDNKANLQKIYQLAKDINLDKKAVIAGDNSLDIGFDPNFEIMHTGSMKIYNEKLTNKVLAFGIRRLSFMDGVAYDAGEIVAHYIDKKYVKENFINKVKGLKKFYGVSGKIYFIDSIANRDYDIIQRRNGNYINSLLIQDDSKADGLSL